MLKVQVINQYLRELKKDYEIVQHTGIAADNHYNTMSVEQICALPVADISVDDSILFLWTTFLQLSEALLVIEAWRFHYKSVAFVWLKQNRRALSWFYGLGYWTRGNAEICLLATKGHPKRSFATVHQLIVSSVEVHSKKPDATRDKILEHMGDFCPVWNLFARQHIPSWEVWGNEVNN